MFSTYEAFKRVSQKMFFKDVYLEKPALNVGISNTENTASCPQIPFINAFKTKEVKTTNYDIGTIPTEKGAYTVSQINDFYMGEPL